MPLKLGQISSISNEKTFGEKLKAYRIAKDMTQQELAMMIGISKPAIATYEINTRRPNARTKAKIMNKCNNLQINEPIDDEERDIDKEVDDVKSGTRISTDIPYGTIMKTARIKRNMSREEIAEKIGISVDMYQKYENNQRLPKLNRLNQIFEALDIHIDIDYTVTIHYNNEFNRIHTTMNLINDD